MRTYIISLGLLAVSFVSCKETAKTTEQSVHNVIPVFAIDKGKPAGSLRVLVKPLCYDDINAAFMRSKDGC